MLTHIKLNNCFDEQKFNNGNEYFYYIFFKAMVIYYFYVSFFRYLELPQDFSQDKIFFQFINRILSRIVLFK